MKIGIYEKAINVKFNWEEKILMAQGAGFDFIEFSIDETDAKLARLDWTQTEINNLKQLLIKHHFSFSSMMLDAHRRYPFGSSTIATRKRAYQIMRKAIQLAKELAITNIQLVGADVFNEESNEKTQQFFLEGLTMATNLAQKNSIMLSLKTMETPFMNTITKSLKYTTQINSPWLNLYPDIGNLFQAVQPKIASELIKGKREIVGIHFKETKPGLFENIPWGEGTVNFVRILKILHAISYNGPFLLMMQSDNNWHESFVANKLQLIKALAFFHHKCQKAGFNYEH